MNETAAYIRQAQEGDKAVREKLITENLGLVRSVAQRFANRGYDREELFQIGCIGLIKAIDRFDTNYQVCFSTYAVPVIMGEIRRFLRDDGMLKVSRGMKECGSRIAQARKRLTDSLNREPTIEEIAKETGLTVEEIVEAVEANGDVISIYRSSSSFDDGGEFCLADRLTDCRNDHEALENRILVEELLEGLEQQERRLIELRYFENKTQTETAKELGISQVQVSRTEKKILLRLRKVIG
ncbi:MAG: SigB/SigF/SigG family RNA polymerase sigma factor [Lachnospiraceae bacterium]|nr:SigB/SigF/SigG family RNA polymerase sigma factor [Lachnospiraceae bacterium]